MRLSQDWTCTDTVLFFYEWLKFEDIYSNFFLVQCDIDFRKSDMRREGDKQPMCRKW